MELSYLETVHEDRDLYIRIFSERQKHFFSQPYTSAHTNADSVLPALGIPFHPQSIGAQAQSHLHLSSNRMATDPRLARLDPRRTTTPIQPPPPPPPAQSDQKPSGGYDEVEEGDEQNNEGGFKLKFCTVCASNQNRYAFDSPKIGQLPL